MAQSNSSPRQTPQNNPQGGLVPGAPPLQLRNLPSEQRTLTPAEQAQVKREQAYQAALRIANLTARWGAAMSTPGVSVTLVQTARTRTASGATQFTYQVAGSGFRSGEKLDLVRWPLGEGVRTVMGGLVLNAQGIAVCGAPATGQNTPPRSTEGDTNAPSRSLNAVPAPQAGSAPPAPSCGDTMKPNEPVQIQSAAAPGEAIRVALIAEDRSNGAATQVIPFPISGTDKSCGLQVLLGMKDSDMVVVEGSGLPPNSTVRIQTLTGSQTHNLSAKTDPGGRMAMIVMPAVEGQTSGITTVRYAGVLAPALPAAAKSQKPAAPETSVPAPAAAGCAPAVSFHWGQGSYKPE
jgi:hypothetical protein